MPQQRKRTKRDQAAGGRTPSPRGLKPGAAARLLGIDKATLRRYFQRPETAALAASSAEGRVSAALIAAVERLVAGERGCLAPGVAAAAAAAAEPPVSLQSRLLDEKEARIADLRAEIASLRGVLEREQSAHARTQALLSLAAPASKALLEAPRAAQEPPPATRSEPKLHWLHRWRRPRG